MRIKRITGVLIIILSSHVGISQFFDFNLFKPSVNATAQQLFYNGYDSTSLGVSDVQVSTLIPIRKKFDVDIDFSNVFKSKGIKSAFKNMVKPKFTQTFARFGAGYRILESNTFNGPQELYNFSAGITGIRLQMRELKFRFLFYSVNVRLQEQLGKYGGISPSVSGLIGSARIIDFRTGLFYGAYGNYFGGRFFPAPVIVLYHKLSRKSSFLLAFPYQVQYSFDAAKVRQSFTASVNGLSTGIHNDSILPQVPDDRLNFAQGSFRFSTQSRFKLAKKTFLYLEAGWQDFNRAQYFKGYEVINSYSFLGNVFIKARLTLVFSRSLFNSSVFDIDL